MGKLLKVARSVSQYTFSEETVEEGSTPFHYLLTGVADNT